jgi:prepilin-type N-terminal cleavage/methylation domain-containing protein
MAIAAPSIQRCRQAAFTLIELLITLVIFSVAITAIYTSYLTQQKTYVAQSEVTAMQQNLRAGMYHLERELRMAGFDPHRTARAGFLIAGNDELRITADLNEDGNMIAGTNDQNEQVRYAINDGYLRREAWGGGLQPLAQNIEVLDLVYLDEDNDVLNPNLGDVPAGDFRKIRSVQITMVARTAKPDPEYRNTNVYRNQQDEIILTAQNDHYRRRTLTTTIRCRNMGL